MLRRRLHVITVLMMLMMLVILVMLVMEWVVGDPVHTTVAHRAAVGGGG